MRFIIALAAAAAIASPAVAASQMAPVIVYFAAKSDQLDAAARARLDEAVEQYRLGGAQHLTLAAHAEIHEGSEEYGVGLSQRRASAVRDYLISRGVPASLVSTMAFGVSRPAVETARPDAANRRVEVTAGPGSGW